MRMITYIYMHTCYCTHVILLLNNLTVSMLSCITRLLEFSKYQKMFQHMPKLAHTDAHTHTRPTISKWDTCFIQKEVCKRPRRCRELGADDKEDVVKQWSGLTWPPFPKCTVPAAHHRDEQSCLLVTASSKVITRTTSASSLSTALEDSVAQSALSSPSQVVWSRRRKGGTCLHSRR